jgi:hypothetical protein
MVTKAEDNGGATATLLEEPEKAVISKLKMNGDHERKLVRQALEDRIATVEQLAKKNEDEEYPREARNQRGDAQTMRYALLNQVRESQMTTQDGLSLVQGLIRLVEPKIRASLPTQVDSQKWKREDHAAKIASELSRTLDEYVTHVADIAWQSGFNARNSEPEQVAFRCLDTYDKHIAEG